MLSWESRNAAIQVRASAIFFSRLTFMGRASKLAQFVQIGIRRLYQK
jgi:hypothetical protein